MSRAVNRNSLIIKKSRGKRVLDLGCIGFYNPMINPYPPVDWLHKEIVEATSETVGVDIEKDKVEYLAKQGYNIVLGNVEELGDLNLDGKFDVIVAGEILEHVSNPVKFLESIKELLRKDGELIITTPNCHHYLDVLFIIFGRRVAHTDHVCWYDEETLRVLLSDRYHFKISEFHYYYHPDLKKFVFLRRMIERLLFWLCPQFAPGVIVVATLAN